VPYKNIQAIVESFAQLPDQTLLVAGNGPEMDKLRAIAGPNVRLLGYVEDDALTSLMARASAFLFAAEEDFGIVLVEAQAMGTPVIALGRGGARETVIVDGPDPTGLFFDEPKPDHIAAAVRRFQASPRPMSALACHANAMRFSESRFYDEFERFMSSAYEAFNKERNFKAIWPLDALEPLVSEATTAY
jgi:glycosyltransferase involved in cell wall biosynthesis